VALGAAYELRKAHHIDALIGLPCSVGKKVKVKVNVDLYSALS